MNDLLTIGNGSVVRLRNFRHYGDDRSWAEFRHNDKKKVFLALILGDENFDGPCSSMEDIEKMLNRLGWYKKEEKEGE
jgi:hypothetical protein